MSDICDLMGASIHNLRCKHIKDASPKNMITMGRQTVFKDIQVKFCKHKKIETSLLQGIMNDTSGEVSSTKRDIYEVVM